MGRFRPIRLVTTGAVLAILVGNGCSDQSRSGQAASPTTAASLSVSGRLGSAPTTCPGPKPHLKRVTPSVAPAIGREPVWGAFYARLDPKTGALHMGGGNVPRTRYGWRDKVIWLVGSHHKGVIRLRGHNVTTGSALRFKVLLSGQGVTTVGLLNHGKPGAVTNPGEPKTFPSSIYFPKAGCYALNARWGGGSWRLVVGLGR
jgi:hypothetical protein